MKKLKIKFKGSNPFVKEPEIGDKYLFTIYEGDVEIANGIVEVTNITASYYTLKVLSNEPAVPDNPDTDGYVGQSFKVKVEDINKSRIPLYASNGTSIGLSVSIAPFTENIEE